MIHARVREAITQPALRRYAVIALVAMAALVSMPQRADASQQDIVSARLGISAGVAIEDAPLGLQGPELRQRIPILFETARRLDVRVRTVSVGQGFFADNGVLFSEKDLDLVVVGRRDRITTMAATLGKAFDQSVVFVWFFGPGGDQATATIPLPFGAEALTTQVYQRLITELADGGHVRYAGNSDLIFVANTGNEPEAALLARMERVRRLLATVGIATGPVHCVRADFLAIERGEYERFIIGGPVLTLVGSAAPETARFGFPNRACI
jgi:hypothetical protein